MITKIKKMNKKQIIEVLNDKKIAHNTKAKKSDLLDICMNNRKISIANRTGQYYFATRKNTYAGQVCRAIALKQVKSTLDIRKQITKKYSFTDTLNRLEAEHIIRRIDKKRFELTQKGQEIAAMYISNFEQKQGQTA